MDNRRLLLVMLIALPIVILWEPLVVFVGRQMGYDMTPRRPPTTQVADGTTAPGNPALPSVEGVSQPGAASITSTAGLRPVNLPAEVTTVSLGSAQPKDPTFAMQLRLSSRGAGIEGIVLNDFQRSVEDRSRYEYQMPYPQFADDSRPMATTMLGLGDGDNLPLQNANWTLLRSDSRSATFALEFADEQGGRLRLTKTYTLATRAEARDTHRGFQIAVSFGFENLGSKPYSPFSTFVGPNMPPRELDRGSDRHVIGGYVESGRIVRIRHDYLESFSEKQPRIDFTKGPSEAGLLWAGTCSVYFNATLRPDPPVNAEQTISPQYISQVEARVLDPHNPNSIDRHVVTTFSIGQLKLEPGQSITLPMRFFAGPRLRSLLNNEYLSALPLAYHETLVLTSGPCAWCTFQWLVNILVWLLGWIHFVVRDWGVAIIILVLLVRALLHPITKKSQVNMMKMSKFGPELERIKTRYKDDPQEQQRAMVQFYKEHGATPILGCLPMFLQMPIWIALFSALQSTFELRQAPFLQFGGLKLTWISDLSQPDHLIRFNNTYNFLFIPISGLNLLPFALAVVFWLQHKFTPKPPTMTPEQAQQQKMMQWMTLLFPVFLYGGPSGLNLYILASTTFGIIESKIIRDHVKRQEELEKAGAVIVDAEDTPRGKRERAGAPAEPAAPKGWLARKMDEARRKVQEMQKLAEQQQRQQKKRRT